MTEFFIGCNTPNGFASRLEQLTSPNKLKTLYILKGGAGSGKSTIMKKVSEIAISLGEKVELIRCSSDCDSLDGVILNDRKIAIFDGTLPHPIEPQFIGVFEHIINLSEAFDHKGLLEKREEIISFILKNKTFHQQCVKYLSAANTLMEDNYRIACDATNFNKIKRASALMAHKIFTKKAVTKIGTEHCRLLSAVSNRGYFLLPTESYKLYLIEDPFGAVTHALLSELRTIALGMGYDVYSCFSPFAPNERLQHLIIPEANIMFMCQNILHTPSDDPYKVISFKRFTNSELIKLNKHVILTNKKSALSFIEKASESLVSAKANHDIIENLYRPHINFDVITKLGQQIIDEIF